MLRASLPGLVLNYEVDLNWHFCRQSLTIIQVDLNSITHDGVIALEIVGSGVAKLI